MHTFTKTLAMIGTASALTATASAQTAWQGGATPYIEIKNEPPPRLIVDPPLPEGLPKGLVWIQYRAENVRIGPVLSEGALKVSPRVGHLHITVDDLPWLWADTSNSNTIDIFGLPPGPHKCDDRLGRRKPQSLSWAEKGGELHHAQLEQPSLTRCTTPKPNVRFPPIPDISSAT